MGAKSFRELEVWQLSMELVQRVYALVGAFPTEERYALSDQLRRAAVSIPSNIAEGFGRDTHRDFARFLVQARGSLYEVDTQIEIAVRLGYCTEDEQLKLLQNQISRSLRSLIQYLGSSAVSQAPSTRHQAPSTRHQAP